MPDVSLLDRPTRWQALRASAVLSFLFLVIYGACNNLTALRDDVGVWVHPWERHIPFVPIMIIPYLSIDLLFVIAPFLCTTRGELRLLSTRIVMALIVAGGFFLAMPLRFSFARPPADGVLGAVFDWFREIDKPFNQFPSLHIAYRTILADLYSRHTRGPLRWAFAVWFSLIGVSTVLVYQHHVVDIVGGFALAAVCFYTFGDASWRTPAARNRRVGTYYAVAAAVFAIAGSWLLPWGFLLYSPAIACAIVATGYFHLGPAIYRKSDGRLPLSTRVLLAPVLLGQWLSLKHYARRSRAWDRITDHLWLGRVLSKREAETAITQGVCAVLDLTGEFSENAPFRRLPYLNIPILDLTGPQDCHLDRSLAFLEQHCKNGVVYVHCKAGYSRSAAVVAAYLIRSGKCQSADEAAAAIRAARDGIVIRPEAAASIERYCCILSPSKQKEH